MKTLAAIIHARKDSTRCPNKHLRDLNGTTLIDIALENLSKLDVDEKYLAVYDQELKDKIIDGVEILHRDYDSVAPGNCHHSVYYKHLNNVKSEFTFIGVKESSVEKYEKIKDNLFATVKFVAEVISVKKDRDNKIIEGNPDKIKFVTDSWKFTKNINNKSPNWYLSEIISQ